MPMPLPVSRRIAAVATACVGLTLASAAGPVDLRDRVPRPDPTTSTVSAFTQTAGAISMPRRQVHWLLPDQRLVTDDERLEELRCRRRRRLGSNCRTSL